MLINYTKLESLKHLLFENNCVFPQKQCLVHMVTMAQVALAENVHFSLLSGVFYQAFFTVFELHLLWNFIIQNVPCFLKFGLNVSESNTVPNFLHEALSADSLNLIDQDLFLCEVFLFTGGFTPIFPCCKLDTRGFSFLLLAGMLQAKKNSLFEPSISNNIRNSLISF